MVEQARAPDQASREPTDASCFKTLGSKPTPERKPKGSGEIPRRKKRVKRGKEKETDEEAPWGKYNPGIWSITRHRSPSYHSQKGIAVKKIARDASIPLVKKKCAQAREEAKQCGQEATRPGRTAHQV